MISSAQRCLTTKRGFIQIFTKHVGETQRAFLRSAGRGISKGFNEGLLKAFPFPYRELVIGDAKPLVVGLVLGEVDSR